MFYTISPSPWDGIETQFSHSGDLFIDIHLIAIPPFPVLLLQVLAVLSGIISQ